MFSHSLLFRQVEECGKCIANVIVCLLILMSVVILLMIYALRFSSVSSSHSCFTFVMNILLFLRNATSVEIHRNMESILTTRSNSSFDHFKITNPKIFGDQDQNLEFSVDPVQGYFAKWVFRLWKHLTKTK